MYDNTGPGAKKTPKSPDYKCKSPSCGKAVWLEPPVRAVKPAPRAIAAGPGMPDAEEAEPVAPKPAPPGTAAKDTGLVLLFEDCFKRVTKLCNLQNAAVGPDGIRLTGENVASLIATMMIARSRLIA
jgi:hypothetical protein